MFQFTHVRLLVNDYKSCFLFYRDVMGFDVAWGDVDGPYDETEWGVRVAHFRDPDGHLIEINQPLG